ncbi:caldesmon-like [Momordica charantia]|uniref:Caldesmon-like n=1 Tax=Momordica charantia TaxID=3673 RepID=A0A6J1DXM4_MOMCH|nr:caldesmon-like [Momordica charantia]
MVMIRTTSVVVVLLVILAVGICPEKCRGEDLQSGKDGSGAAVEEKEAKYKKPKEKVEAFLKEAKEIWSKMTSEEREQALAAFKEGKVKEIWSKMTPEEREKAQTAFKKGKVKEIWSKMTPEEREKTLEAFKEGKVKEIWSKMTPKEREKILATFKGGKEKEGTAKGQAVLEKAIEKVETALNEAKEKSKDKADAVMFEKVETTIKEAKEKAKAKVTTLP